MRSLDPVQERCTQHTNFYLRGEKNIPTGNKDDQKNTGIHGNCTNYVILHKLYKIANSNLKK